MFFRFEAVNVCGVVEQGHTGRARDSMAIVVEKVLHEREKSVEVFESVLG